MIARLIACSLLALALTASAQDGRTVKARIVYFQDSGNDPVDLFHATPGGEFIKVTPGAGVGGGTAEIPLDAGGQISLLKSPGPGAPVAVAKVPAGVGEAVFFLLKNPAPSAQGPAYKVLVADESVKNMPRGSCFICNIGGFGSRVTLGGTGYLLPPGKPAYLKQPDKRDAYNMAAFQLEAQEGGAWKPLKDTMIRFSESERYFFLVYSEADGTPAVKIYKQFTQAAATASAGS